MENFTLNFLWLLKMQSGPGPHECNLQSGLHAAKHQADHGNKYNECINVRIHSGPHVSTKWTMNQLKVGLAIAMRKDSNMSWSNMASTTSRHNNTTRQSDADRCQVDWWPSRNFLKEGMNVDAAGCMPEVWEAQRGRYPPSNPGTPRSQLSVLFG